MFKDEYKKMNESIRPDSGLLEKTERSMAEIMNKKTARHMSAKMAVALALAAVLALTGVAFATGAIQSVFSFFKSIGVSTTADIDKLDQLADQDLANAAQEFEDVGEVAIEVKQAYYDGYQLIMGVQYNLKSRVELGLDNEYVALTRPGDPAFCAEKYDSQEGLPIPVRSEDDKIVHSDILPEYITEYMTEEQVGAFEKEYAEKGEAAVVVYKASMSDRADIEGDDEHELSMETDERAAGDQPDTMYRYIEFDELTGEFANRDEMTVTFGLRQTVTVCRVDSEGIWTADVRAGNLLVPCTVRRNDQKTDFAFGSFGNEVYNAKAELRMTDVSSRILIDMIRPEEWSRAYMNALTIEDGEVDYIWSYCVRMPDGSWEKVINDIQQTETGCHMEGSVDLYEGQTAVVLRPLYTKKGLVEGEDIVIYIGDVSQKQTAGMEQTGPASAELSQAYYDGSQLIVGAKYKEGATQVILGLEHEALAITRPDDASFCATKHESGGVYINSAGEIPEKSKLLPPYITQWMTDEQIAEYEKAYAETGEAGVVLYTAGMSDLIAVEGDEDFRLVPADDHQVMQEDGSILRYVDFGNLISECRDKEQLTVTLLMGEAIHVVRTDKDGIWVAGQPLEQLEFPFVVKKNDQNAMTLYGSYENELYSAKAELLATEVSTRIVIDIAENAEWAKARSTPEMWKTVDFIRMFYVMQPDGSMVSMDGIPTDEGYRMEGAFDLQEGQTEITIRPWYSVSGYHADEDIIISLENGISSVK